MATLSDFFSPSRNSSTKEPPNRTVPLRKCHAIVSTTMIAAFDEHHSKDAGIGLSLRPLSKSRRLGEGCVDSENQRGLKNDK